MLVDTAVGCHGARWFRSKVAPRVRDSLNRRRTQINALELIGVVLACEHWNLLLQGRRLIVFIDNTVALQVLRKGRSGKADLNSWAARLTRLLRDGGVAAEFY